MRRVLSVLGFVWALPTTALGLVLGLLTFQVPRLHASTLVFDRRGPRGLTWLLAKMHRSAMTVGFVIVSSVPVEGHLLLHERQHVRQSMLWGPLFVPAYLLLAMAYGYRRHPMEVRARRAAGEEP